MSETSAKLIAHLSNARRASKIRVLQSPDATRANYLITSGISCCGAFQTYIMIHDIEIAINVERILSRLFSVVYAAK